MKNIKHITLIKDIIKSAPKDFNAVELHNYISKMLNG
jgi:hypothetical protein